jgi:hypothetical protein
MMAVSSRSRLSVWHRHCDTIAPEADLAENEDEDITVVPLPASESQAEHDRIRRSNDRDQALEREGKPSRHNQGYDEVADLKTPEVERVVDE